MELQLLLIANLGQIHSQLVGVFNPPKKTLSHINPIKDNHLKSWKVKNNQNYPITSS